MSLQTRFNEQALDGRINDSYQRGWVWNKAIKPDVPAVFALVCVTCYSAGHQRGVEGVAKATAVGLLLQLLRPKAPVHHCGLCK